ncbi:MAG: phosphotyrosine protein phosphatase [Bacteroidia bacterium]
MRSATAHQIYQNDERFEVRSAGTHPTATITITEEILNWADSIVVMEKAHRNFIRNQYFPIYQSKKIVCLYIPDDYEFMAQELIDLLTAKFENIYQRGLI